MLKNKFFYLSLCLLSSSVLSAAAHTDGIPVLSFTGTISAGMKARITTFNADIKSAITDRLVLQPFDQAGLGAGQKPVCAKFMSDLYGRYPFLKPADYDGSRAPSSQNSSFAFPPFADSSSQQGTPFAVRHLSATSGAAAAPTLPPSDTLLAAQARSAQTLQDALLAVTQAEQAKRASLYLELSPQIAESLQRIKQLNTTSLTEAERKESARIAHEAELRVAAAQRQLAEDQAAQQRAEEDERARQAAVVAERQRAEEDERARQAAVVAERQRAEEDERARQASIVIRNRIEAAGQRLIESAVTTAKANQKAKAHLGVDLSKSVKPEDYAKTVAGSGAFSNSAWEYCAGAFTDALKEIIDPTNSGDWIRGNILVNTASGDAGIKTLGRAAKKAFLKYLGSDKFTQSTEARALFTASTPATRQEAHQKIGALVQPVVADIVSALFKPTAVDAISRTDIAITVEMLANAFAELVAYSFNVDPSTVADVDFDTTRAGSLAAKWVAANRASSMARFGTAYQQSRAASLATRRDDSAAASLYSPPPRADGKGSGVNGNGELSQF